MAAESSLSLAREIAFSTMGGIGLLIFGIRLLGEGLQKAAGDRLRRILSTFTSNPVKGAIVGTIATAIIQSSSATTVMLVGFVNAGIMTLEQALGVIFGANIGTTITVKMVAFHLDQYALPAIGIGLGLNLIAKRNLIKSIGTGILGFGLLFLGIVVLKEGVAAITKSPKLVAALQWGGDHRFFGLIIAMLITDVVQSSSATTSMVLAMAIGGVFGATPQEVMPRVLPLILGCNIGTCITALLASIGTNIAAKRVAVAHIGFNILGATWVMLVFPLFVRFVLLTSNDVAQLVANSHILFNLTNTLVFIGFTKYYARLLVEIVPGPEPKAHKLQHLDNLLLHTPSLAISASERELVNMAEISRDMMQKAMHGMLDKDRAALAVVTGEEHSVDEMQAAITEYLVRISEQSLTHEESEKLPALLHIVNDLERIGDHAENLVELAQKKLDDHVKFSKKGVAEIREMFELVDGMFGRAIEALCDNDPKKAATVIEIEERINALDKALRDNHVDRLKARKCKVPAGVIYLDLLTNFEKIGDHLTNVADAVGGVLQWGAGATPRKSETAKPAPGSPSPPPPAAAGPASSE